MSHNNRYCWLFQTKTIYSSPTRYADNPNDSNLVTNLIFLCPNSSKIDKHIILPESRYLSDHAFLIVYISIVIS